MISPVFVGDHRADRHAQRDVVAALAVAVGAAVLAALGAEFAGVAVVDQGVEVAVGDHVDAAAAPPSPPFGPPFGMYFSRRKVAAPLPPSPAVTSISGFVDEFHA
jgi:hypothetical protein